MGLTVYSIMLTSFVVYPMGSSVTYVFPPKIFNHLYQLISQIHLLSYNFVGQPHTQKK